MFPSNPPSLPERVKLLDHAGVFLAWLPAAQAAAMLLSGEYVRVGTKNRTRGIKIKAFDYGGPAARPVLRTAGYGSAHRRERWHNPPGVWTLDFMPAAVQPLFQTVVEECLA